MSSEDDHSEDESTANHSTGTENADGTVDGTFEARVGDTPVSYPEPEQTARTLMEDADYTDDEIAKSVLVAPADEEDYRPNEPVDLSDPGRERFFVQTRTDGNSDTIA